MATTSIEYPKRTRKLQNHHYDSSIWDHFEFRPDDIIIGSYGKSGTTWTQQIISQLLCRGAEEVNPQENSPWMDMRLGQEEKLEQVNALTTRRYLKSHAPVDALGIQPGRVRYVVLFRDGRDAVWSMHNHFLNANDLLFDLINDTPGRVGPPLRRPPPTPREYFEEWSRTDGLELFPYTFWHYLRSWWAVRRLPNVLFVHFANLKRDLAGEMRRIARFLDIDDIDEALWPTLVHHCTFDYMKEHADRMTPLGGAPWKDGGTTFINKGTNGRWKDELSDEAVAKYEARAKQELGDDLATFVATGEMPEELT